MGGAMRSCSSQQSASDPHEHRRNDEAHREQHAEQHVFFALGAARAEQAK